MWHHFWKKKFIAPALISIFILAFSIHVYIKSGTVGEAAGKAAGTAAGTAIGSLKGITVGREEGEKAGTEAGLSAEDTTVDIRKSVEEIGNLEVLSAKVTLTNLTQVGDSYAGLERAAGKAIFSVDLSKAEITFSQDGKNVYIKIPKPEMELYLDQESTEQLAEKQKFSLKTTPKDGITAYLNSMAKITEKSRESIVNYDSLVSSAEDFAVQQVKTLAEAICSENYTITVELQ